MIAKPAKKQRHSLSNAVLEFVQANPGAGQFTVSRELGKRGIKVSPSGVRSILKRNGLETGYKRLVAFKEGALGHELSEDQLATLKRKRKSNALRARASQSETLSEIRRDELLQAAAKIFSKKGFAAASLREICGMAGIQPTSLYYHFRSKESLFAAVHKIGMERANKAIDASVVELSDPWQRLEAACATAMSFILDSSDYAIVVRVDPSMRLEPALQRQINQDRLDYERRFRRLITDLPLEGGIDRSLFRLALLGAMNWSVYWYKQGRWAPAEIGRRLAKDVFRATSAPAFPP
jgi:AcrR family transcriptional regulator